MIKDNIKIIKDLTKIFLKSAYQDINIINKETKKINKRSVFVCSTRFFRIWNVVESITI